EERPAIGLIAHMDTVSDFCDAAPNPQIIENYDGRDVPLGTSGRVLRVTDFPHLSQLKGRTLITTDGTTILGSDDKSGIAEIMTVVEQLAGMPHGPVSVAFTPDEEIGRGTDDFRTDVFGAKYAFTLDGAAEGEVQYESFNAAGAEVSFRGNNVHPGSAKNVMLNAALVAMEFNEMLNSAQRPEYTENYQGFIHLTDMTGSVAEARLKYILRDHDRNMLAAKKAEMKLAAQRLNEKYGAGTVELVIQDQYQNMAEILKDYPEVMEVARKACRSCGVSPISVPIRGQRTAPFSASGDSLAQTWEPAAMLSTDRMNTSLWKEWIKWWKSCWKSYGFSQNRKRRPGRLFSFCGPGGCVRKPILLALRASVRKLRRRPGRLFSFGGPG
ncbi:MAG: peptidase T, partial [Clostridia bacterium]|nr:peptidase T [Clostridia bacterium]